MKPIPILEPCILIMWLLYVVPEFSDPPGSQLGAQRLSPMVFSTPGKRGGARSGSLYPLTPFPPCPCPLPAQSPRESTDTPLTGSCAGVVFHTGGFCITVTIMGRKAAQALFRIHSSLWVTFGFWLLSACLVRKEWFSVNSSMT